MRSPHRLLIPLVLSLFIAAASSPAASASPLPALEVQEDAMDAAGAAASEALQTTSEVSNQLLLS